MKSPDIIGMPGAPGTAIYRTSRRPIRVGVVILTTGYGSADTIVLNWLQALQRTPHIQSYLFAFAAPQRFLAKAAESDTPVHRLPWSRSKPLLRAAKVLAAYVHA